MTENQYAQLLLERLSATEAMLPKPRIVSFLPSIMQTLANRIADHTINRPSVRELLRKDFSVSVASGTVSLTTPLTAAEPLLEEFARGWIVTSVSDLTLGRAMAYSFCVDKASFQQDKPKGIGYFLADGSSLYVMTTQGVRTPTATYVIHGSYVPIITNLPVSLEDDALNVGVELLRAGAPQPPEPAGAEDAP